MIKSDMLPTCTGCQSREVTIVDVVFKIDSYTNGIKLTNVYTCGSCQHIFVESDCIDYVKGNYYDSLHLNKNLRGRTINNTLWTEGYQINHQFGTNYNKLNNSNLVDSYEIDRRVHEITIKNESVFELLKSDIKNLNGK